MSLSTLLKKGYMDWLSSRGVYGSQAEWAMELGVSPVTLNRHYLGRSEPRQGDPVIERYAEHFGPAVYSALGLLNPDPAYQEVVQILDEAPKSEWPLLVKALRDAVDRLNEKAAAQT